MLLTLISTIGAAMLTPLMGELWRIKRIRVILVFVLRMRPALPIGAESSDADPSRIFRIRPDR